MSKYTFSILYVFLVLSCAQKSTLTGGPKDEEAPKIMLSSPSHLDTLVNSSTIELNFNEYIDASTLPSKLLISPTPNAKPEISLKGKTVQIKLQDSLQENTTYILQFNQSIVDITERNPIANKPFVFSTGLYIDSATLQGKIIDALSLKPVENCWVLAYQQSKTSLDSILWKQSPTYITKSKADGTFTFEYLAPGGYTVFCLEEEDQNFKYNEKVERVAFDTTVQHTTDSVQYVNLKLFKQELPLPWAMRESKNVRYGLTHLYFTDTILNFKILNLDQNQYLSTVNKADSSVGIILYDTALINNPQTLIVQTDAHLDTLKSISFKPKTPPGKVELLSPSTTLSPFERFTISVNQPVLRLDTSLILFKKDSSFLIPNFYLDASKTQILCTDTLQKNTPYTLRFYPNSLYSHYFKTNTDTLSYHFSILDSQQFATLTLILVDSAAHLIKQHILELTDNNNKIVQTIVSTGMTFTFPNLPAGSYKLKLTLDANENKRWSSGNVALKIQPETIIFFEDPLEIKGGFDQEITWILK